MNREGGEDKKPLDLRGSWITYQEDGLNIFELFFNKSNFLFSYYSFNYLPIFLSF